MPLQLAASQGERLLDQLVEVERRRLRDVALEVGADASDQRSRAMAVGGDPPERLLGPVEIRRIAVEKAKARIGGRDHRRQRLPHLVGDRGRDRVSGHQARLALAPLAAHRAEEPRIQRRDLVQQDGQHEAARQEADHADGIPAGAEAHRRRVVAQRHFHQVQAHHDHQPEIENRASAKPEHDDGRDAHRDDRRADEVGPVGAEAARIEHDARQLRVAPMRTRALLPPPAPLSRRRSRGSPCWPFPARAACPDPRPSTRHRRSRTAGRPCAR